MPYFRMFSKKSLIIVTAFYLIIGCSSRNDDHYNRLGINYLDNGQYKYAINALKKAIKLNPSNSEAHFNLGRSYKRGGMDEKARAEFSISSSINPEIFKECVKKYREKMDYEFTGAQHYIELGNAYAEKGMINDAIDAYKKVMEIDPDNVDAHYSLGMLYSKKGMLEEAADAFWMAIEIEPDMPEAHYNLGLVYYKQGMFEKAITEYQVALKQLPETQIKKKSGVHYKLGLAYQENGMFEEAIRELNKALELMPEDSRVRNQLGLVYKKAGLPGRAEE